MNWVWVAEAHLNPERGNTVTKQQNQPSSGGLRFTKNATVSLTVTIRILCHWRLRYIVFSANRIARLREHFQTVQDGLLELAC